MRYARRRGGSPTRLPSMISLQRVATEGWEVEEFLHGTRIWLDEIREGNPRVIVHLSPEGRERLGFPRNFTHEDAVRATLAD